MLGYFEVLFTREKQEQSKGIFYLLAYLGKRAEVKKYNIKNQP